MKPLSFAPLLAAGALSLFACADQTAAMGRVRHVRAIVPEEPESSTSESSGQTIGGKGRGLGPAAPLRQSVASTSTMTHSAPPRTQARPPRVPPPHLR